MGTLLEKTIENIFKNCGFEVRRDIYINDYEIDLYARLKNLNIVVQCKQYEKSHLNITDLLHLWNSKNQKIKASKVIVVVYGQKLKSKEKYLANELGIELWGDHEIEKAELLSKSESCKELLEFINLGKKEERIEIDEEVKKKSRLWPWLVSVPILLISLMFMPSLVLAIGGLTFMVLLIKYIYDKKK